MKKEYKEIQNNTKEKNKAKLRVSSKYMEKGKVNGLEKVLKKS